MTDNEIIKALECCCVKHVCSKCPYSENNACGCINGILRDALDLINRQKAEIERLQIELNRATYYLSEIADDWEDWDD